MVIARPLAHLYCPGCNRTLSINRMVAEEWQSVIGQSSDDLGEPEDPPISQMIAMLPFCRPSVTELPSCDLQCALAATDQCHKKSCPVVVKYFCFSLKPPLAAV